MSDTRDPDVRADRDVEITSDGDFRATSEEPWVSLVGFDSAWRGRFIEITYRTSWLDEPARPVFRFRQEEGACIERLGAASIVGSGSWIGRVPARTTSLSISPTNRLGRFGFHVEMIRKRSWLDLIRTAFVAAPSFAWRAVILRLIGFAAESDQMLAWALSGSPIRSYSAWDGKRWRPFDRSSLDRSRDNGQRTTVMCVLLPGGNAIDRALCRVGLSSQIFEHWSASLVGTSDDECPPDRRYESVAMRDLLEMAKGWSQDLLVCVLTAETALVPEALAYVVEQAERHPEDQVFYGDIVEQGADGVPTPVLLPGWSPRFYSETPYLLGPVFFRAGVLTSDAARAEFLSGAALPEDVVARGVRPLRRILATTSPARHSAPPSRALDRSTKKPSPAPHVRSTVSIIIPTRDNIALLARLIASIVERKRPDGTDFVVVNNGGSRERIVSALAGVQAAISIQVIDYNGVFNFSAICNAGAAATRGDALVFLNDDMEVLSDDWLDRLVAHAMQPDVGAVGAKLVYPDGRLQHVGITIGLGECAGHFGALEPQTAPGWTQRNAFVHEIGAVTGACLAVERSKFEAVGGFDAKSFPVELGDVDLCLKLRDRGWTALMDPEVRLMHLESKSRGRATFRRLAVHASERAVFCDRWRRVLRNDPYFHPGLSLYSRQPVLG